MRGFHPSGDLERLPGRKQRCLSPVEAAGPPLRSAPRRLLQQLRSRTERQMELRGASLLWDGDVAGTGASGSGLKREHLRLLPESLCIVQEEPRQRVSQQPAPGAIRAAAHMLYKTEGSWFSDPGRSLFTARSNASNRRGFNLKPRGCTKGRKTVFVSNSVSDLESVSSF